MNTSHYHIAPKVLSIQLSEMQRSQLIDMLKNQRDNAYQLTHITGATNKEIDRYYDDLLNQLGNKK